METGSRLLNKVVIVAGGASGIGAATCRAFAAEGIRSLAIADVNCEAGQALENELADTGRNVVFESLDVTSEQAWTSLVAKVVERSGKLDILVNCAGIGGPTVRPTIEHTELDAWEKTFAINSTGMFLGMKHVIPAMRASGGGSIVNVASIYGLVGPKFASSYAASKGACRSLSRTGAVQYAAENIRVNAVFPGYTDTPMTKDIHTQPEVRERRLSETPMGRFGQPHEIAMGLLYLASDEASFVTGAELVIDGGMTAQ
jgi:cyclopentanol dehydrogenase